MTLATTLTLSYTYPRHDQYSATVSNLRSYPCDMMILSTYPKVKIPCSSSTTNAILQYSQYDGYRPASSQSRMPVILGYGLGLSIS